MRSAIWLLGVFILVVLIGMQSRQPDFDLAPVNAHASLDAQLHPDVNVNVTLRRSCNDCHSMEVKVPWYGHVWPVSVLLRNDMRAGRARLDLSNWSNLSPEMAHIRLVHACRAMRESEMPLWYYRALHPAAAPNHQDVEAFCSWVQSMTMEPGVVALR